MFTPSVIIFAILALTHIAVATSPACFLDVIGAQPNPADVKAICGKYEEEVMSKIYEKCKDSDDKSSAISFYSSSCRDQASMTISTSMYTSTTSGVYTTKTSETSKSTETSYKSSDGNYSTSKISTATSTKSYPTSTTSVSIPKVTGASSSTRPVTVAVLVMAGIISRLLI